MVAERRDGSTLTVKAKAVIVATGGFGGNTEMVKKYSGYDVVCGCLTQDIGEGIQMAWDAGAARTTAATEKTCSSTRTRNTL